MRWLHLPLLVFLGAVPSSDSNSGRRTIVTAPDPFPIVETHSNRVAAGTVRNGVLTIRLVARPARWFAEKKGGPSLIVQAFGEDHEAPRIPGPLIRVREGTEILASVRNDIPDSTLVVHGLHKHPSANDDTIQVAPGATREVRFSAGAPGTYFYWASTTGKGISERSGWDSQLSGAFIVDARGARANDEIFVISLIEIPPDTSGPDQHEDIFKPVINGRMWPHTDRTVYNVGDSVRWRWINTSDRPHPMHLHGFYYRVDGRGDERTDTVYAQRDRRRVVTELLMSGTTIRTTWVPERPGNWMMHCHMLPHISPRFIPLKREQVAHGSGVAPGGSESRHALENMSGLVLGVEVRPRPGNTNRRIASATPVRKLRLVAQAGRDSIRGFVLQNGPTAPPDSVPIPGSPIVLTRGEPVSITVVNKLGEPTSVHWHGIELESFYDGVAGWSGAGQRLAPLIAAHDSFTVKFTPPRAGTFMYHTHMDDGTQLESGMYGPLLVLEPGERYDPETDRVFMLSERVDAGKEAYLLQGDTAPPPIQLTAGRTYRFRFLSILLAQAFYVSLRSDSSAVSWRPLAKDGARLPAHQMQPQPASFLIGVGENYDYEFTPARPGKLELHIGRKPRIRMLMSVR
ncbi:MAG: multicopper oxidase domain-containing protein [Gemmatimonadaceae bacterium]